MLAAGQPERALELGRSALASYGKVVPEPSVEIANTSVTVGAALAELGRVDEAHDLQSAALERATKALGERHPNVGLIANRLAETHLQRNDLPGARAAVELAIAALDGEQGDPEELVVALLRRGSIELRAGRIDAWRRRIDIAVARAEQVIGPNGAVAIAETLGDAALLAEVQAALARARAGR